jgi:hypothetical protein
MMSSKAFDEFYEHAANRVKFISFVADALAKKARVLVQNFYRTFS